MTTPPDASPSVAASSADGSVTEPRLPDREKAGRGIEVPDGLVRVLWLALGLLFVALIGMAGAMLAKIDFFSGAPLTEAQLKSLWAFLGVALGAVATLLGALLTDQHNRRTDDLARESAHRQEMESRRAHTLAQESAARLRLESERQHSLNAQAESRLALDTVAKLLDLLTTEKGEYAPKARVGGAVATMMELHGASVAIQVLGDLWAADKVDTGTAVWIVDRTLQDPKVSAADAEDATYLLTRNACKLFPADGDSNQHWSEWPQILRGTWPCQLPPLAQQNLLMTAVYALLGRRCDYWTQLAEVLPIRALLGALDAGKVQAWHAAQVLFKLHGLGVMDGLWVGPPAFDEARVRALATTGTAGKWWTDLLGGFDDWARGEKIPNFVHPDAYAALTPAADELTVGATRPAS